MNDTTQVLSDELRAALAELDDAQLDRLTDGLIELGQADPDDAWQHAVCVLALRPLAEVIDDRDRLYEALSDR